MNRDISPEKMQKILDQVRDVIPHATWDASFSVGSGRAKTWVGFAPGYRFVAVEHDETSPMGLERCYGTVGISEHKMALKLPPELATLAVAAAKGDA